MQEQTPQQGEYMGHVDGIEQLEASGVYRLAGKFTVILHVMAEGTWFIHAYDNDARFCGIARQWRRNGIHGAWSWTTATGNGSNRSHTSGPQAELVMVDGHLLPPIDKAQWSLAPSASGMTMMLVTERERAAILAFRGEHPEPPPDRKDQA